MNLPSKTLSISALFCCAIFSATPLLAANNCSLLLQSLENSCHDDDVTCRAQGGTPDACLQAFDECVSNAQYAYDQCLKEEQPTSTQLLGTLPIHVYKRTAPTLNNLTIDLSVRLVLPELRKS